MYFITFATFYPVVYPVNRYKNMVVEITEQNFESFLASGHPLVVEFGAEWCRPCQSLKPILNELSEAYKDKAVVATCDVEENNDIAVKYTIRNVPTILFFKDGEIVHRQVGAIAKTVLEENLRVIV
nr:MAG TPA: thioredoxin [Bacteriophage sp.]